MTGADPGAISVDVSGAGPTVALLHGFGADRLSWLATRPALEGRRVLGVDLPGHGQSLGAGPTDSLPAMAAALADRLAALADGPMDIVGHSLGGGLALAIAADRPALVRRIVLIAPLGLGRGIDADFLATLPETPDRAAMQATLARLVADPATIGKQTAAHAFASLDRPGARAALRAVAGAIERDAPALAACADRAAAADLPRHVIWGAQDAINPLDRARLQAFGPHTVLAATGHLPHVEAVRGVKAELAARLA